MKKIKKNLLFVLCLITISEGYAQEQFKYVEQKAQKIIPYAKTVITDAHNDLNFIEFEQGTTLRNLSDLTESLSLSPANNLVLKNREKDRLDFEHLKYVQMYNGIEIIGGEFILHCKGKTVNTGIGHIFNNITLDIEPSISEAEALKFALKHIRADRYMWQDKEEELMLKSLSKGEKVSFYPKGKLVITSERYLRKNALKLAYLFDIYAKKPLGRFRVEVDAHTGQVINKYDQIHHIGIKGTGTTLYDGDVTLSIDSTNLGYFLSESTRGNGINTYDMKNRTSYSSATIFSEVDSHFDQANSLAGVSAHFGAGATYDYFLDNFGRNSFDNNGATINSYVHYSRNYSNAFWDGSRMTYGDGNGTSLTALVSLDIVGHEITHAVTQHTANLVYAYESGALNESFSDIFGQAIEFENFPATANWALADQIYTDGTSMIRSIKDPNSQGHPDTYKGNFWESGSLDNGGVHINSGVMNHWFYLLTDGDTGTNDNGYVYDVPSIGLEAAQQIAYRNLSVYLTTNSQYVDARVGAEQSAIDLFGENSAEHLAVIEAWNAVGVPTADPLLAIRKSVAFADVPVGYPKQLIVNFTNQGAGILLIDTIIFNNADFSVSNTNFSVESLDSVSQVFTFTPSTLGSTIDTVLIKTNAGENLMVLSGNGVQPPVVSARPDSLHEALFSGGTSTHTLTVKNSGTEADLDFTIDVRYAEITTFTLEKNTYTLPSHQVSISHEDMPSAAPTPVSIKTTTANLVDLTDITIAFYSQSNYSVILSDLALRGADTTLLDFPLAAADLEDIHVIAVDDAIEFASAEDIAVLRGWINSGGSLMLQADNIASNDNINSLLLGSGIEEVSIGHFESADIDSILAHPITRGVSSIYSVSYGSYCTLSKQALPLAFDNHGRVHVAVSSLGRGKIVAVGNEIASSVEIDRLDTRLFCNQLFDWLSKDIFFWLEPNINTESVSAGDSLSIYLTFDAANLVGGSYQADLLINTNDPANRLVRIPVQLDITGAADINVDTDTLSFGTQLTNNTTSKVLLVTNKGTDTLLVSNIFSDNPDYASSDSNFALLPKYSKEIRVSYSSSTAETDDASLMLLSNDPYQDTLVVVLMGKSAEPPAITVKPDSLYESLSAGNSSVQIMKIDNTHGSGSLTWDVNIEESHVTTSYQAGSTVAYEKIPKGVSNSRVDAKKILNVGGPDNYGYEWVDSDDAGGPTFQWEDISKTGINITGSISDDNVSGPYPLGFSFEYYGDTYTAFYVSSNGFISFQTTPSGCCSGQPIPKKDVVNNIVAWAWRDAYPFGNTYYQNFTDKTIIQFTDYGLFPDRDQGSITAEIIIYKTGKIRLNYLTLTGSYTDGSHSIGIENKDGTDGLQVAINTSYLHNNLSVLFYPEPKWLVLNKLSGAVGSGSNTDVTVIFDATDLKEGTYKHTLLINSNDPTNPLIRVPVQLDVRPLNQQPTNIAISKLSIEENSAVGTLIGLLTTTDPDETDTHEYTIFDSIHFKISEDSLLSNTLFDYESHSTYAFSITTTDAGGLTYTKEFNINLIDNNDAPNHVNLSKSSIEENSAVGTLIGLLTTTDPDETDTHEYTISDSIHFKISEDSLLSNTLFDYESRSTYAFSITTTDAGGLTYTKEFNINLIDNNDAPNHVNLSKSSIEENSAVGTLIGLLTTTDPDETDTHEYTILDSIHFKISEDSLLSNTLFDYESRSTYAFSITTTDAGGLTYTKEFNINLIDNNDAPKGISLSGDSILENLTSPKIIGIFNTLDEDITDMHTYNFVSGHGDMDNGNFTITGDTLWTNISFDYESQDVHTIRVASNDNKGDTFEQMFRIGVINVNEAPTISSIDNQYIRIGEFLNAIDFTIDDIDTELNQLTLSASSSNQNIVRNEDISFDGQGYERNILLTHSKDTGSVTIHITVSDAELSANTSFKLLIDKVLGTSFDDISEEVALYPNPAQQEIFIRLGALHGEISLQLLNSRGQVIREKIIENQGFNAHRFSLDGLPKGTYIMQIRQGKSRAVKTVIKQ